jgi:uncharacterized RDD family membrane protein YckC
MIAARPLNIASFLLMALWGAGALAQSPSPDPTPQSAAQSGSEWLDSQDHSEPPERQAAGRRSHGHDLVNIGRDSVLPAGEHAGAVVSVLGNARVEGSVGESTVAVLGDAYIDGPVDGDVVVVLGNVELGPHATVGNDVVAVGGAVQRDPASSVHGGVQSIFGRAGGFGWLRTWFDECVLYGRPLALAPGLDWAWGVALVFLALYVCLALVFRDGVSACVRTLEEYPGMAVLSALVTVLLVPVLLVLLCITVIGIAAVPFVLAALLCAGVFGKAVMLAWIGRRCLGAHDSGPRAHPATAVLIGGLIVLVLYVVPVLGFVVYKLLGLFGLGTVVYTLLVAARAWRESRAEGLAAPSAVGGAQQPGAAAPQPSGPASEPPGPASQPPGPASQPPGAAPQAAAAAASAYAPPPSMVSAALPRAGFWVRMAALLLDVVLVGVVVGALHHMMHLELAALAIYGAAMWKLRGATIGGIVFDLQVVRLDGRQVNWETAIVRALGCFLSLAVAGLGFFWIAFDPGKQAWHDKIAGTAVVRVAKGVPLV